MSGEEGIKRSFVESNGVDKHEEQNGEPPKKKICVTLESYRAPRVQFINDKGEEVFEGYLFQFITINI